LSTGQPCNAAQYAAELVCLRKREKENCGSLEFKFWNKSQKEEYQTQIRVASNLISKYSEKALIRYLNSPSGNNVYALGFLHKSKKFALTLRFVEKGVKELHSKLEEESKREKKIIEAPKGDYKPKKSKAKNSLFSKIRKIDGKG
jgi:hypothetical protein